MPIIQIKMNTALGSEEKNKLLTSISQLVANVMEKLPCDIMIMYSYCDIFMGGSFEPAAFVDFRCVSGLNHKVSKSICECILDKLKEVSENIEASRVYVNFFEVNR